MSETITPRFGCGHESSWPYSTPPTALEIQKIAAYHCKPCMDVMMQNCGLRPFTGHDPSNNTRATMTAVHFERWHSVIADFGSYDHACGFIGYTYVNGKYEYIRNRPVSGQ